MVKLVSFSFVILSVVTRFELVHLQTDKNRPAVRGKRVINGRESPNWHRDHLDAIRYYVFLTAEKPSQADINNGLLNPEPDELSCGGSLLTPSIVQTAAHCIAVANQVTEISPLVVYNVWENPLYSYIGNNEVFHMTDWLEPRLYHVPVSAASIRGAFPWIDDIGFIFTKEKVPDRAPLAPISYAPVYPRDSIIQFYREAIAKEYMCLVVGHGAWDLTVDEFWTYPLLTASNIIRWGWRTVMNVLDCEYATYPLERREENVYNYSQCGSWVCFQGMKNLVKYDDYKHCSGSGDSGGPWTCNNVLFAVVSGMHDYGGVVATATPIVQTIYENSAETRDEFIEIVSDHGILHDEQKKKRGDNDHGIVHDELKKKKRGVSRSSPKLFINYLLLLAIVIGYL